MKSSEQSVLSVVLEADVERTSLIAKEKVLLEQQQTVGDEPGALQNIMDQLTEVYERMQLIGAQTAESRAASILSGMLLFCTYCLLHPNAVRISHSQWEMQN